MIVEYEKYKQELAAMEGPINELGSALNIDGAKEELRELEQKTLEPDFYSEPEKSQKTLQKIKQLGAKIKRYEDMRSSWEDCATLVELAIAEDDAGELDEITAEFTALQKNIEETKLETLLSGPYDKYNAILTLHAGAGGTEAQDWCAMLCRMYQMWAERRVQLPVVVLLHDLHIKARRGQNLSGVLHQL